MEEYYSLLEASKKEISIYSVSLLLMTKRILFANDRGHLKLDAGATQVMHEKITHLRVLMAEITEMFDGRMPLQYVHFLNLLVYTWILLSPFALFPVLYYW